MTRHRLQRASLALALAAVAASSVVHAGEVENQRARDAIRVLAEMQAIPESAIPDKLLDEARAIVIVPDTLKAGLVIGGRRGRGLMMVKSADGSWSNPSFVTLTGGSIGFQAGVQSSDVVLVFHTDRGVDSIVNGKFTLGADAAVAAGPVGRNAATATDGRFKAEIWSWSRARGLFAGVALDGAVLSIDDAANQSVYGNGTTPRMIFESRAQQAPPADLVKLRDTVEEATASAHASRLAEDQRNAKVEAARAASQPRSGVATTTSPDATQVAPATTTTAPAPEPAQGVQQGEVKTEALPPL